MRFTWGGLVRSIFNTRICIDLHLPRLTHLHDARRLSHALHQCLNTSSRSHSEKLTIFRKGFSLTPPTHQVGAKCLFAVVLDNQDGALSQHDDLVDFCNNILNRIHITIFWSVSIIRLPTNSAAKHVCKLEVATTQWHSFASTELMQRPRSDSPLHFDIKNIYQIRTEKSNASARCLLPATLLENLPSQDHVWITTVQWVLFHKNKFDEMLCKNPVNTQVRLT